MTFWSTTQFQIEILINISPCLSCRLYFAIPHSNFLFFMHRAAQIPSSPVRIGTPLYDIDALRRRLQFVMSILQSPDDHSLGFTWRVRQSTNCVITNSRRAGRTSSSRTTRASASCGPANWAAASSRSTLSVESTAADMVSLASTLALAPTQAEAGKTASCAMRSTTSRGHHDRCELVLSIDLHARQSGPGRATESIPFGKGTADGRMYEPRQVPIGKQCGCVCPACSRPVYAKHCRAGKRAPHFAHAPGADCGSATETSHTALLPGGCAGSSPVNAIPPSLSLRLDTISLGTLWYLI